MKIRWLLFSAAILIGFLPSQVTSEEVVLGQGNISCGSWIENRRDDNPLAATRTAWVLGFITAFNQYGAKPQRDVSGGKDTEVLMARIDDHCKRHPLDNLCIRLRPRSLMSSDSEPTASSGDWALDPLFFGSCVYQELHPY